jgi:hypothetical protein
MLPVNRGLSYHQVRLKYSLPIIWRANLIWLACLFWGIAIASGAPDPAYFAGTAALSIMPLVAALKANWLVSFYWVVAHSFTSLLLIIAMRQVIWPSRWRAAEAALPIQSQQLRLTDALLALACMLPLIGLYSAGLIGYLWYSVPKANIAQSIALVALLILSLCLSLSFGLCYLKLHRARTAMRELHFRQLIPARYYRSSLVALVIGPILNGVASRTRQLWFGSLTGGLALIIGLNLSLDRPDSGAPYWLAALSLLLLTAIRLIRKWTEIELAPIHFVTAALPINPLILQRWRRAVPISLICLLLAIFLLMVMVNSLRLTPVLLFYSLATLGSCIYQATTEQRASEYATLGWIVNLVALFAIGSQVFK